MTTPTDARTRFGAVDVHYPPDGGASAALVVAADPMLGTIVEERVEHVAQVAPYVSGQLYLRELPPVLAVLAGAPRLDLLVVDGYVDLDPSGTPGLGRYVHRELAVPVIGVAKTRYRGATHAAEVLRGGAMSALHVTCVGLALAEAVDLVEQMAGAHRLPAALRRVDALARGRVTPVTT